MDNITPETQSPSPEGDFDQRINNILANGYSFTLGAYITKGHNILKNNFGSYIGYLFVIIGISIALGLIPIIGSLANWVIEGSLSAGFFIVAWRIVHNKPHTFGNFFDGFRFLGPLFLLSLMISVFMLVIIVPYVLITLGSEFGTIRDLILNSQDSDANPVEIWGFISSILLKLVPLFLILIILSVLWSISSYIVVFARKGFWEAMTISSKVVWKNFISFLAFYIVLGAINIAGTLCFLVGLLYTIPLTVCAMFAAYDSIVGTTANDME